MRTRHWEKIQKTVGKDFKKEDEVFKLKDVLETDILNFKTDVEDVAYSSVKEAEIEKKIGELETEWKDRELLFANYEHKGPVILKGQETSELMENLEDAQMNVSSIMTSRFVAPFRETVSEWMHKFSSVTDTLKEWLSVQSSWLYLDPIFTQGDIPAQLPVPAKKFQQIDKNWVKIMQKANSAPNVLKFCYENEMLKSLPYLKEQLDQCQKSLTGYLGKKRDLFPRFYFCSDPILLAILSHSSNPQSIQEHLSQIFDSIKTLTFDEKITNKILEMISSENEVVSLNTPVVAKGNVEDWLTVLEKEMQSTMKNLIRGAAEESVGLQTADLEDFCQKHPAQVALLGIQFLWTNDCTEAIKRAKTDSKSLDNTLKKVDSVLKLLTTLTRKDLSFRDRIKIETLITIQVHQRDVFRDEIRKEGVKDLSDFNWQKQARFYWVHSDKDTCMVSVSDIDQEYCYEYLGCKERLVITPLTDRCYITLCQAIGLKLGGAPAGKNNIFFFILNIFLIIYFFLF